MEFEELLLEAINLPLVENELEEANNNATVHERGCKIIANYLKSKGKNAEVIGTGSNADVEIEGKNGKKIRRAVHAASLFDPGNLDDPGLIVISKANLFKYNWHFIVFLDASTNNTYIYLFETDDIVHGERFDPKIFESKGGDYNIQVRNHKQNFGDRLQAILSPTDVSKLIGQSAATIKLPSFRTSGTRILNSAKVQHIDSIQRRLLDMASTILPIAPEEPNYLHETADVQIIRLTPGIDLRFILRDDNVKVTIHVALANHPERREVFEELESELKKLDPRATRITSIEKGNPQVGFIINSANDKYISDNDINKIKRYVEELYTVYQKVV